MENRGGAARYGLGWRALVASSCVWLGVIAVGSCNPFRVDECDPSKVVPACIDETTWRYCAKAEGNQVLLEPKCARGEHCSATAPPAIDNLCEPNGDGWPCVVDRDCGGEFRCESGMCRSPAPEVVARCGGSTLIDVPENGTSVTSTVTLDAPSTLPARRASDRCPPDGYLPGGADAFVRLRFATATTARRVSVVLETPALASTAVRVAHVSCTRLFQFDERECMASPGSRLFVAESYDATLTLLLYADSNAARDITFSVKLAP